MHLWVVEVVAIFRDPYGNEIILYPVGLLYKSAHASAWEEVKIVEKVWPNLIRTKTKSFGERLWRITPFFCTIDRYRQSFDRLYPSVYSPPEMLIAVLEVEDSD